ncbi:MAG TPA: ECF-type sigma factor [Longimicrobiales bacterium]|nr:ECF-type sigma factor [Longimicrobiales bacterium]
MATHPQQHEITEALLSADSDAAEALQKVMPLVYDELRRMAHRQLRAEPAGHTLSTTALVHEAYVKLVDQTRVQWTGRAHFFAVAAQAMRRILVDYARRHRAARRGGSEQMFVALELAEGIQFAHGDVAPSGVQRADELIALDEALERLAVLNPRLARIVEYRFFGGLSEKETAEALGISQRTASREWLTARGWLYQQLREG